MHIGTIIHSTRWRRRFVAILFGVCATLALPPVYAFPLLVPAFTGLFLLVQNAPTRRQAFLDGWWWGLGHFTTGLYWICISLYVEPEKFAWLTPFALFGLPCVLGVYTGLVTGLLHLISYSSSCGLRSSSAGSQDSVLTSFAKQKPRHGMTNPNFRIVLFALLWVTIEYLRAHLFTGFPWNLIGYSWTVCDVTLQLASVVGIYGLSWLTVMLATLPALYYTDARTRPAVFTGAGVALLWIAFGWWRLEHNPTAYTPVSLRIVQGNIEQHLKMDAKAFMLDMHKYVRLTRSDGWEKAQITIWPEAAIPFYMTPALAHDLGMLLPEKSLLIAGGLRGMGEEKNWQAWNSLFAIDHFGNIPVQYDKHHLVPFGEFIPLRNIVPVENIAGGMGDFSRGPGPQTLTVNNAPPFSPLICYEAIFPAEATDGSGQAAWLLNVTNDAWFGASSGPYQHLQMARTRAVEQGLPLVRAANTGISAVIDAQGRIISTLPLGKEGVLDAVLPERGQAILSRFPWMPILFVIAGSIFFALLPAKGRNR